MNDSLPSLILNYSGKIPSMKNSRVPILVGKGTKKRVIFRKNDEVMRVMRELANLAQEARMEQWDDKMLPDKTPFAVVIDLWYPNWVCPDLDGSASTILDALQGVLYSDDRYCVKLDVIKHVNKAHLLPSASIQVCSLETYNKGIIRIG